jgi:hypothetical protein
MTNIYTDNNQLFVIYKIIRDDNLIYIGKTKKSRLKYRMSSHAKSQRFKDHTFTYEILFEHYDHNLILNKETEFVKKFNSFEKGLNKTPTGQGQHLNSYKFTTLGFKFTEQTKQKLRNNHWARTGKYTSWNKGEKVKELYPHIWDAISKAKKGKPGKPNYTYSQIENLIYHYQSMPYLEKANKISKNGRYLSYLRAFANEYSKFYNMTPKTVINILNNECYAYREVYERCFNTVNGI